VTDNDGDGLVDCEDSACASHADCTDGSEQGAPGFQDDDTAVDSDTLQDVAMVVEIRPEHPLPSDDLECVITTPAMGPTAVGVAHKLIWTRDGVQLGDSPIVSSAQTSDGETWSCEVTATDSAGAEVDAAIVQVDVKANHPPSAPEIAFEQLGETELVCYLAMPAVDPEEDAVRYRYAWSVDGVDDPDHTCSVLSLTGAYNSGRIFSCTVTPSDAYGEGDSGTGTHVVGADG